MIKKFIQKAFLVREEELGISLLMQLYIFLIITVLLIVKPTVNALFLSELGAANLPMAYMLTALVAVISFYFYNKAVKKFPLRTIIYITLIFFGFCFLSLSLLLHYAAISTIGIFAYYIAVSIFAVLAASQFWLLANMVFNSREAKRLFGFIGAGAISGGILGGYLTSIIASNFGNKTAIAVAALLLLSCIPLLGIVWKMRVKKLSVYTIKQRMFASEDTEVPVIKLITNSKHLRNLAGIVAIGVIVARLIDFQFSDFAHNVIADSDELASFFGFWFSTFNVTALGIQLLLTNRILNKFGVATTLLLMPLAIGLGCLLFLTFPELWVLIILKGLDGVFKQSAYKAALELSIMPIPFKIKNQAKSYIDVVVDSIASGLAGLLLFFVIKQWEINTIYVTVIVLFFLFLWIYLIYSLREAYFESFRKNLKSSLLKSGQGLSDKGMAATLRTTRHILKNGSEEEILQLLNKLDEVKLNNIKAEIIALLDHPSDQVKTRTLKQLHLYDHGTAYEKVKELVVSANPTLAAASLEYLLENTHIGDEVLFSTFLNHQNKNIANAALICLAKEAENNSRMASKYGFYSRVKNKVESKLNHDVEGELSALLIAIGHSKLKEFYPIINIHLQSEDAQIKKNAIKASGLTKDHQFIQPLLGLLKEKKLRKPATKALKNYGAEITNTLYSMEADELLSDEIKPHIPRIIGSFKSQSAIKILIRLLKNKDIRTRLQASRRLRKIRQSELSAQFPQTLLSNAILRECKYYSNSIKTINSFTELQKEHTLNPELHASYNDLINLLREQHELSLQCIFEMLSLKYHFADMEVAYMGIISAKEQTASNALEFLDNLLHSRLKNALLPLLEHRVTKDGPKTIQELKVMSEFNAIRMLLKNRGKRIKLSCLRIIGHSTDKRYLPQLKRLQKHKNPEIREQARLTMEKLKENVQGVLSV